MVFLATQCFNAFRISERKIRSKFVDSIRLHVRGGAGGMGYPKYGGIGGAGGDIYVVGKEGETLLNLFKRNKSKRVAAGTGENSNKRRILGHKGNDVLIEAPIGISLYAENGSKLGEIDKEGSKVLIARGGIGGCPETGHSGQKGESQIVTFDLKLIADVGLVGFPNAGKSTLLSAISNSRPKISSYPFTTIKPNIGVICYPDLRQISVADLPGLIEGAHVNVGMGHKFLKHVERTKLLLITVDVGGFRLSYRHTSRSCLETIVLLNKELELYREDLIDRPTMLVVNKMDKKGSRKIFDEITEAVKDLKGLFSDVPEELRPNRPLQFERVMPMTAKDKMKSETEELKNHIRDILDNISSEISDEAALLETLEKKNKVHGPVAI